MGTIFAASLGLEVHGARQRRLLLRGACARLAVGVAVRDVVGAHEPVPEGARPKVPIELGVVDPVLLISIWLFEFFTLLFILI